MMCVIYKESLRVDIQKFSLRGDRSSHYGGYAYEGVFAPERVFPRVSTQSWLWQCLVAPVIGQGLPVSLECGTKSLTFP